MTITATSDINRANDTNSVIYTISSANYTQTNFRFYIQLKQYSLADTSYTNIVNLTYTPDNSGYTYFNPTEIIKYKLSSDINLTNTGLTECINSHIRYYIYVTEQYGDPIVDHDSASSSILISYNGNQSYIGYDFEFGTDYFVMKSGSSAHWLNENSEYYVDYRNKLYGYFLTRPTDRPQYALFLSSVNERQFYKLPYNLAYNYMYALPVGLNNIPVTFQSAHTYYDVYLTNTSGISYTTYGSNLRIIKSNRCNQYDFTELYWLNNNGGWDTFTFNKNKYNKFDISRSIINKGLKPKYTSSSSFQPVRSKTQFYTKSVETITLNTDILNDNEALLIKSLELSSDVRIKKTINGIDYLIPVIIVDSEFKENLRQNIGLFFYEVSLEYTTDRIHQVI